MSASSRNTPSDLPASTGAESALDITATVASLAPWIGGSISNILTGISAGRRMSRINACLHELGRRVEAVHNEAAERFVQTDDFADLLEETLRRVAMERNEHKRRLFGDFLVNNIGHPELAYEDRLKTLRTLEELQLSHLAVLEALARPPTRTEVDRTMGSVEDTLQSRAPDVAGELDGVAKDLERLGLAENLVSTMRVMMTARGAAELRNRITAFGQQFLQFLTTGDEEARKPAGG